jgi:hypothetical protein
MILLRLGVVIIFAGLGYLRKRARMGVVPIDASAAAIMRGGFAGSMASLGSLTS